MVKFISIAVLLLEIGRSHVPGHRFHCSPRRQAPPDEELVYLSG